MTNYKATPHAVDRALLRFGISSEYANNWFNQLMQTARHIGKDGKRDIYDHKGKRIIINGDQVITIFVVADLPFGAKISGLVERELKRAKKALDKRAKELSIQIAETTVEQATLSLNILKAKSPNVKRKIQTKLDETTDLISCLKIELEREQDEYKSMEIQSKGYLMVGGEVG